MSDKMRESLSALMDDEANELELHRLLGRIGEDAELRETWSRYNAVRSSLSGQPTAEMHIDISARVSAAIAAEDEPARSGLVTRLARPVASLAVAASVMGAVVFGGQQIAYLDGGAPTGQAIASSASPVGLVNSLGATSVQASYGIQSLPGLEPATRTAYRELARQRMQTYLQDHVEHASLNSPHGLLPFARVGRIAE